MYKIPAKTLFMGKEMVFMPQCQSTNSEALRICSENKVAEGVIVITDHQEAGRGQRGNAWESAKGLNLTFSVILRPTFIAIQHQFLLNVITSLALVDSITALQIEDVKIKWPNDVYVGGKKVSGILIENQLSGNTIGSSILGIGLNVNQENFQNPSATSLMNIANKEYALPDMLIRILENLEARYLVLRSGRYNALRDEYEALLYWRHEHHNFLAEGEVFRGSIEGINGDGQLLIHKEGQIKIFGVKQIAYLS